MDTVRLAWPGKIRNHPMVALIGFRTRVSRGRGDVMESDYLVDVHVASLRRKLRRADPSRNWIRTVDGSS